MLKSNVFEVTINSMHSILLPENEVLPFVEKNHDRIRVIFTYKDKSVSVHASLKKIAGHYRASLNKALQKELGIFPSDYFNAQIFEDTTTYGVDMPEEFQAVLDSDLEGFQVFESLTRGKQRSLIYAIKRHKNSQTKIDKSLKCMDNLKRGIRDPKLLFR